MHSYGTVYWITGLSGAGKTTIGQLLYEWLVVRRPKVVFLDGDLLREVFGDDLGHSLEDRRRAAMRNARICKLLADQGIDVVCATVSMFHECQRWNRENINSYREVYIRVPIGVLIERDPKKLYSRALHGELKDVMGIDLEAEEPEDPDIVVENDGTCNPEELVDRITKELTQNGG